MATPFASLEEVTPEMIEAGLNAVHNMSLSAFPQLLGPTREQLGGMLEVAFKAMLKAKNQASV